MGVSWHYTSENTQIIPQTRSPGKTAGGMYCCQPEWKNKKTNTWFWLWLPKLTWCYKQVREHFAVVTTAAISGCERNKTKCYFTTLIGSIGKCQVKKIVVSLETDSRNPFPSTPHSMLTVLTHRNFSLKVQMQLIYNSIVLYMMALMTSYSGVNSEVSRDTRSKAERVNTEDIAAA